MSDQKQSRSEKRSKRRKTNRILNTAIVVVIVLIVIVAYSIFSGGNDEEEAKETNTTQQTESPKDKSPNKKQADSKDHHDEDQDDKKKKEVIEEEGDEPNVDKNIKDPSWEPIGTEQTGTHSSSFDMGSVDWNEKVQALSYATGISEDNMIVWFIKGAGPDKAIGTVSPKDSQNDAYRVHIKWVDGEGWKPTKVQKLIENDKGM
ncbi:cytoskeletal protein RodZ [Oikeobacillus pervagus]|uniref:Cytoskeletal protein RodZ n=1 Tax=Oikeobacillus pervagus TaxID=1325931 RepID=A0AAJ1SXH6_9BACI|nr:YrrS family protein [Oikeobacillus pervagus]MDQ0214628.1 cytoskeletal protein RodZ [Oikeobacillus pervagus]